MRIIGNVIGNRGSLCFQAGEARNLQIVQRAIVEDRLRDRAARAVALSVHQRTVVLDEAFEAFPSQVDAVELGVAALELGDEA